ncbi:MAG TPA: ABC transporter permease [Acidimicrobiales bacterium]|jgi:ABC-2 type transport system permease protein|nr:ABC transporter permease [Acidimicrobiales bacterium]
MSTVSPTRDLVHEPLRHPEAESGAREISKRPTPLERVVHLWRFRELLVNLVRKDLKVRYKSSVLGFFWSLLNPALYIVVFSFVFGVLMTNGVKNFALFMMAGLLPWNFFVGSVMGGTGSIVANGQLVTKVWFPREVLPLATVGASLVHFFLQSLVLLGALLVFRQIPSGTYLVSLAPALLGVVVFTAAVTIIFAALDVYLRDMQHLAELMTLAWFWATPIVYPVTLMGNKIAEHGWSTAFLWMNPMTAFAVPFQRVLYNNGVGPHIDTLNRAKDAVGALPHNTVLWYTAIPTIALAGSLVLLYLALALFSRLEDNMAEEI